MPSSSRARCSGPTKPVSELYYAKMEEFVSLRLEGKLDLASLMKREADTAMFQQTLERKQVEVESGYARKHEELEKNISGSRPGLRPRRGDGAEGRAVFGATPRGAGPGILPKLVEMHEMEFSLSSRPRPWPTGRLISRASIRSSASRSITRSSFRAEVDDQVRWLAAEQASLSLDSRPKRITGCASAPRSCARPRTPSAGPSREGPGLRTENRLAEAQQKLLRAESVAQTRLKESVDFSASRDAVEKERPMLLAELAEWKQKAAAGHPRLLELEKLLAQAQSQARSALDASGLAAKWREELGAKQRELEAKQTEWSVALRRQEKEFQGRLDELQVLRESLELERPDFFKELNDWRLKAEAQEERAGVLEARLSMTANTSIEQMRQSWEAAAEQARVQGERVCDLENRLAQTEAETAARYQAEIGDLQGELARKETYMAEVMAQVEEVQRQALEAMDPQSQANQALAERSAALEAKAT